MAAATCWWPTRDPAEHSRCSPRPRSGVLDVAGSLVRIDAAGSWHETALELAQHGLAGVESLVGIPGTVGGGVVQNIGAYGHEICEVIERVKVLSVTDGFGGLAHTR